MRSTIRSRLFLLSVILLIDVSCQHRKATTEKETIAAGNIYTNPLLECGAEPWTIFHEGKYYYTQDSENRVVLRETDGITDLSHITQKGVQISTDPSNSYHLWVPEIHRINNKWYIYFATDDDDMDNHQVYVVENEAANPMEGTSMTKGRMQTNKDNNWTIHASTFEHDDQRYMIWYGWQKRKIDSKAQCIYIATMKNSWTLPSDRTLVPKPEYEWECQWVNPDGSKTACPIHVSKTPQYFEPKNRDKACTFYLVGGSWTPCYCVELLTADAKANLLSPASWKKFPVSVLQRDPENDVYGPGGVSFTPSPDGEEWYMLYHARQIPNDAPGVSDSHSFRLQKIDWDKDGIPVLETPQKEEEPMARPSGSPIHRKQN